MMEYKGYIGKVELDDGRGERWLSLSKPRE